MTTTDDVLSVLRESHDTLTAAVTPLSVKELNGPAYPRDWSIARTLSHLGSGAEMFRLIVDAALAGSPTPGMTEFQAVWAAWDARSAREQGLAWQQASAEFLDRIASLTEAQRADFSVELFGEARDLAGLLLIRLNEQILHAWDILVTLDPAAELQASAVPWILDGIGWLTARGAPVDESQRILVSTEHPDRHLVLTVGPQGPPTTAEPDEDEPKATLRLPAEAFVRLVYGRLDPANTPPVQTEGVSLDVLRSAFPGF